MYQSHTHILTISNGMNMSLLPHCFSVLKMYMHGLNYQVFPMKTCEAFQIWKKIVENKWERNQVPLGERKLLWLFYVFFSVLCLICLCERLSICALWSPAGRGMTSWLSFVVSNCEFVTFPLVFWVGCGT